VRASALTSTDVLQLLEDTNSGQLGHPRVLGPYEVTTSVGHARAIRENHQRKDRQQAHNEDK
jgi:hypothetical protein